MAKILVADDNSNIQKMVGLALKDQGIDVVAVGNGEAAVRKISDVKPDLVLADVFMPVRNGYEVCRYVKEDSTLSHIPVILLVGAFDPLDEQEAQRVGADGVLKKPFVPPDPLISMVKSALTRAGVSLGPAPAADKGAAAAPPKRSTQEILTGAMSSKLASFPPEKLPEAEPEPVEEFPAPPSQVKIAAGSEPLAFGSLLDTSEAEDAAITAKPMIDLSTHNKWEQEPDEVEEEKEEGEESPRGGWRPGGLDEVIERAGKSSPAAPDWREEAFHGDSPAKSFSPTWAPAAPQPEFAEAAESQSVAVATVTTKPAENAVPFASDAWAAAMAAGVEEKLAEGKAPETVEAESVLASEAPAQPSESSEETSSAAQETAAATTGPVAAETTPASEPANWAAVPETAWEVEAKKASLLASTWDAPKAYSPEETQDVPVYSSEPQIPQTETPVETEQAEQSAYSAEPILAHEPLKEPEAAAAAEAPASEPAVNQEPAPEVATTIEPAESKSWEHVWEAPAAVPAQPSNEEAHAEPAPVEEPAAEIEQPATPESPVAASAEEPVVAPQAVEPNMDELVARVLSKMNPDVLQRVTREILKPVIEAIVRDEINSKKS